MITVTETEGVTNLTHYKNSRPENLSGSEEKIGVFIANAIFAFPSGFIFRMILPLNLDELDGLVAGSTLRLVENAARMFSITLGIKPVTRSPNMKNPSPNPKNLNPKNPSAISGSKNENPKLIWVIRVYNYGTRIARLTRNIYR